MAVNAGRYKNFLLLGISIVFALTCPLWNAQSAAEAPTEFSFSKGETIIYSIKKFKLTVGTATLTFNGPVSIGGQEALEIVLTAKGLGFFDEEKIYIDPVTYYPTMIKRDLNIFGVKEEITEFYDPQRGKIRIVKTADGKTSEEIIESGGRFDNIYGFIYRYRQRGEFKIGEEIHLHLPTRDVIFKLIERKNIKAGGRKFDAYYMDSVSRKYKVWFDSGPKRIPLKIDGAVGFGNTSMIMKEYRQKR